MPANAKINRPVVKVTGPSGMETNDALAIEQPLEIRLEFGPQGERRTQNVSVTMRTPGNDEELAVGFLFTEGIIRQQSDVLKAGHAFIACAENKENIINISLEGHVIPNLRNTERNFYTTSSCGVCGKGSIDAIRTVSTFQHEEAIENYIEADLLYKLPDLLRQHQQIFADTGGLHASALFGQTGNLLLVREDVGRHNALDKLLGAALKENWLPLNRNVLLLSGRASFELVQKAAMAGINIIAAVGAPSSLAVELASEFSITLIGFLRDGRFNIYTGVHRVQLAEKQLLVL